MNPMETILVDSTGEQRIRITRLKRTRDNSPRSRRSTNIGQLLQMYGSKVADYGDETMGTCDLGFGVDMAIANGDKVLEVRIDHQAGSRLSVAEKGWNPNGLWDTSHAGVYIVPRQAWNAAVHENHLRDRIQGELDEVNAWLNQEIYEARLEQAVTCTERGTVKWTSARKPAGPFYGNNHALTGLYRAMALPHDRDSRDEAGWRELPAA